MYQRWLGFRREISAFWCWNAFSKFILMMHISSKIIGKKEKQITVGIGIPLDRLISRSRSKTIFSIDRIFDSFQFSWWLFLRATKNIEIALGILNDFACILILHSRSHCSTQHQRGDFFILFYIIPHSYPLEIASLVH